MLWRRQFYNIKETVVYVKAVTEAKTNVPVHGIANVVGVARRGI